MSTEETVNKQSSPYVLIPATIVEMEETGKSKKGKGKNRLPYGAKAEEGGYSLNGTFYTDFTSDLGKKMIKTTLLSKLEFVFSDKYFSFDQFIRPYMDVEGYFPIPLLLFIPAIQSFGIDAEFLAEVLKDCPSAEVDPSRFTVRLKTGWEKWLLANPNGGMGVPRYAVITEEE